MLTVACVLKSGGEFGVEHVCALSRGVREHLCLPHRFVCLTDRVDEVHERCVYALAVPLIYGWPGWWSKIELFWAGRFDGAVFYLDLDTMVVGPLDDIVLGHRFTVLRNFWASDRIGSGLMAWDATAVDLSRIYQTFKAAPEQYMREFVTTDKWGDQGFINAYAPLRPELWQVKHPGGVVSYKKHVLPNGSIPRGASIICYHGLPRPWQTELWNSGCH